MKNALRWLGPEGLLLIFGFILCIGMVVMWVIIGRGIADAARSVGLGASEATSHGILGWLGLSWNEDNEAPTEATGTEGAE